MENKSFGEKLIEFIKKYAMVIVLFGVFVAFYFMTGKKIIWPSNVSNLIGQNAHVFILATGMLLCILTGGNIDLSVGSVVCFTSAVGATLMAVMGVPAPICVVAMAFLGILIGATQAFFIAYVRIPPFIVTLAGMFIFRGFGRIVLKGGKSISLHPYEGFLKVFGGGADCYLPDVYTLITGKRVLTSSGDPINITCIVVGVVCVCIFVALQIINRMRRKAKKYEVDNLVGWIIKLVLISGVALAFTERLSKYNGIPSTLVIVGLVVLIYTYITTNTKTGRYFYAVGGNEKATKLSGINTNWTYFLAYMNMGFLASLAGMLTMARAMASEPNAGTNYEMDAIASCFIGGAAAYGGTGTVPGAIIGALLMGLINIGMNICKFDMNLQSVVKGGVLLAAVFFDVVSKRRFKIISKD